MMADHQKAKKIKVSGTIAEVRGYYHIKLTWIDAAGERKRKSITTGLQTKGNKKRAEEMLVAARKEQEKALALLPGVIVPEYTLFADFLEAWLEAIRRDVKPTTFGGYQINVKKIIGPYFRKKGIVLGELTADHINTFYSEQLKRVKAMTVHRYHANLSKALKYAVEKDYIPHSPMGKVKRPKLDRFVGKFLKESEVIALVEAVKGHRLELGVVLGSFYGLRRSEVVGLRWESINFETNTITIEHTVTEANVDGKKIIVAGDTTKSKSSFRTLPLVDEIRVKLLEIKEEQERNRKLCGKAYNKKESDYIYTDSLGNRIKPGYLTNAFPEFLEKHGFKRMRFHDLRHSCASLLLANGISLKEIQEWLGHSDFAITANIYAHLDFDSKKSSAEAMKWIGNTSLAKASEDIGDSDVEGVEQSTNTQPLKKPVNPTKTLYRGKHGVKMANISQ